MSASRLLGLVAAVPLLVVGLAPASTATAADPAEAKAPTQLLQLTTAAGDGTAVAEAGLDEAARTSQPSAAPSDAPAATSGGSGVAPGRTTLLAAATAPVDPEKDATLLTKPIAVDDFLIAGFSWKGSAELPTGTQIYLRVREDGVWSSWYLNQASDAGRDDGTGLQGTDEFVTGGADAVQASIISPSGELPADLNLAMVPGQPTGQEQVDASELETVDAEPTEVVTDDAGASPSALGPLAEQTDDPTASPSQPAPSAPGSTGGGSAVSPAAATLLAATTTANSLPVPVTTRSEWGANESYMTWTREYYEADHVVVHHTAGTNNYTAAQSASIVNGIYYYHAVTLGWGDIGYNFLVSKYGQVFEGRSGSLASAPGKMVAGGHALGVNNGTMGVSMMGDFTATSPSSAQVDAVGKMAGWFLGRQGVTNAYGSSSFVVGSPSSMIKYPKGSTQSFTYIFAHRDVNYTTCPGDVGYSRLSQIRAIAQQVMGASATTWKLSGSTWYLYSANGTRLTGWQLVKGTWYYLGGSGAMRTGWQQVDGTWYYLGGSGGMRTGWQQVDGAWYYLGRSGAMATGWQQVNGTWYYLGRSGAMATGWLRAGSTWFYMGGSGGMRTGWQQVDGAWYYLDDSGVMRTGWQQVDGAWYYLGRSGAMATGWLKAGSTWFYMDRSGAMRTGWQKVDGTWYYLDDSGAMVTGRRVIDGRASSFGSNGAWLGYATSAAGATSTRLAPIMGAPSGTRTQVVNAMVASYQRSGATFPSRRLAAGGTGTLRSFATVVYDEAVAEGVRPEVLFAQMMKETGWLRFGGDVRISQYNFGGLGATGGGVSGASFADVRTGVRAQVQHLRAYADPSASTSTLHRPLVDPRFTYVTKGSARYVEHLGIHENPAGAGWASAVGYGASVRSLMTQIFG